MARKPRTNATNSDSAEFQELVRKLLAVTLYQAGANYDAIAKVTGKRKAWVVEMMKGLPARQR